MKNNKILSITTLVLLTFALSGCTSGKSAKVNVSVLEQLNLKNQNNVRTSTSKIPIVVSQADYMGATTETGKILESDNIFVATVQNMKTSYTNPVNDSNGNFLSSIPRTEFHLKVLENLQGNLPTKKVIKASRSFFGYTQNQNQFMTLIENDIIPEKGKTYIFLSRVVDGKLYIQEGGNVPSNFPLDDSPMDLDQQSQEVIKKILVNSKKIKSVEAEIKNEKIDFEKFGRDLVTAPEIEKRLNGNGNKVDFSQIMD
ncbi:MULTISPECIES: hypothetical protein [unclassified Lactococcus]|uniref:hypothetical protein n=1 Tax=unclassified Lactococcus TaxID=2643510 RepID=UPI0011C8C2D6|nr:MULTISPECIES: hypothetical protein [unclassified Lactococcus]MQW23590.1 hypothetical protein [Lactococcus sp. dk101]TXK37722.1 hypothetical protein FVP42_07795 [Lactococcus sp. dk310]TXK49194.1 hypothetical protein FVP43_07895 [Lactococcus sp. dk322]